LKAFVHLSSTLSDFFTFVRTFLSFFIVLYVRILWFYFVRTFYVVSLSFTRGEFGNIKGVIL
ncbi:hypothetical protein, partial [Vibrio rotiferianus]|uniref:hypothetical protein n=1 Tax=Vibrio rotiferianus TaxID=190895 RepID=UPI0019D1EA1C